MNRLLPAIALLALAGAASAQSTTDASANAESKLQAEAKADAKVDRYCIQETGTRIKATGKANTDAQRKACTAGRGRVYTRQDIDATGRVDLADALRALDPSIR